MKAREKAIFSFDAYVNGDYSNEASFGVGNPITLRQAISLAKKRIRLFSVNHVKYFLYADNLAVADVTMFNREITIDIYHSDKCPKE